MKKLLLSTLAACILAPAAAWAEDLALKLDHDVTTLSADGVTRITRFSERLIRRDNEAWLARVIPHGAHDESEHQTHNKSHKHMDVSAAARWVVKKDDGKLQVRIVNVHEKMVVDIAPVDYANIGFDGKWVSVSTLLDPEQIKRMKPLSRTAPAGSRWYESGTKELKVLVLWDEKGQYPRRVESRSANGVSNSTLVVTREPMPATMPWSKLTGYAQKEYSDLLD